MREATQQTRYSMQMIQECYGRPCQKIYIAEHQKATRGYKAAKDRVTLMLTMNASDKMNLHIIHCARKFMPYRNNNMTKLNVHWLHKKVWTSSTLCLEWFDCCFVPDVEFCLKKKKKLLKFSNCSTMLLATPSCSLADILVSLLCSSLPIPLLYFSPLFRSL